MTPDRPAPVEVVAAAIVRDGRVLAARRSGPHRHAGRWEFPGGKVERGETGPQALARECREELGADVRVGRLLATLTGGAAGAGAEGQGPPLRLAVHACTLQSGEPHPVEDHDELRWLTADRLDALDWLPIDRAALPAVAEHLRETDCPGRL